MRSMLLALLFVTVVSGGASARGIQTLHVASGVRLAFSPHGGGTELVVSAIEGAKREILVQAYSFTSTDIAKAYADNWAARLRVSRPY